MSPKKSESTVLDDAPAAATGLGGLLRANARWILAVAIIGCCSAFGWRMLWEQVQAHVVASPDYRLDPATIEIVPERPEWIHADSEGRGDPRCQPRQLALDVGSRADDACRPGLPAASLGGQGPAREQAVSGGRQSRAGLSTPGRHGGSARPRSCPWMPKASCCRPTISLRSMPGIIRALPRSRPRRWGRSACAGATPGFRVRPVWLPPWPINGSGSDCITSCRPAASPVRRADAKPTPTNCSPMPERGSIGAGRREPKSPAKRWPPARSRPCSNMPRPTAARSTMPASRSGSTCGRLAECSYHRAGHSVVAPAAGRTAARTVASRRNTPRWRGCVRLSISGEHSRRAAGQFAGRCFGPQLIDHLARGRFDGPLPARRAELLILLSRRGQK